MPEYYFTFGQRYRHEHHPADGHPDGWFTIVAPDIQAARTLMFAVCGPYWSHCYNTSPPLDLFPRGELRRLHTLTMDCGHQSVVGNQTHDQKTKTQKESDEQPPSQIHNE